MDDIERFRTLAREQGATDESIDRWLNFNQPRVELHATGEGPPAGRFGGRPSLPESSAWPTTDRSDKPTPFLFLAEVDCAVLAPEMPGLPPAGTLQFFVIDFYDADEGAVLYHPPGTELTDTGPPPDSYEPTILAEHPLHVRRRGMMPPDPGPVDPTLYDDDDPYVDLWDEVVKDQGRMHLGGPADGLYFQPPGHPEYGPPYPDVVRLAEFRFDRDEFPETDDPPQALAFVIHRDDLAARAFDRAWTGQEIFD